MRIGMVGLGRMRAASARRLVAGSVRVVGFAACAAACAEHGVAFVDAGVCGSHLLQREQDGDNADKAKGGR